jgi:uncharacterized protein (TIGR03435 family)
MRMRASPGRVDINAASLIDLISNAYGEPAPIPTYRISGVTSWMQEERFDIQATIPEGAAPLNTRSTLLAVRKLLTERFNLRTRLDTVEGAVYMLTRLQTVPKTADRLTRSKATCDSTAPFATPQSPSMPCDAIRIKGGQSFRMEGTGVTMAQVAGQLSAMPAISRPVIDRTGLSGRFDFTLEWVPPTAAADNPQGDAPRELRPAVFIGPSVFVALEEQFGLRLESSRGPVDVVIIESAQRPTAN